MSEYALIEKYRTLAEELEAIVEAMVGGNPAPPVWIWIIIAALTAVGGGVAIYQFWRGSSAIVGSIEQTAPIVGTAFSMIMLFLAFMPFFFIFSTVVNLLEMLR